MKIDDYIKLYQLVRDADLEGNKKSEKVDALVAILKGRVLTIVDLPLYHWTPSNIVAKIRFTGDMCTEVHFLKNYKTNENYVLLYPNWR
jgi:hypothetical protein